MQQSLIQHWQCACLRRKHHFLLSKISQAVYSVLINRHWANTNATKHHPEVKEFKWFRVFAGECLYNVNKSGKHREKKTSCIQINIMHIMTLEDVRQLWWQEVCCFAWDQARAHLVLCVHYWCRSGCLLKWEEMNHRNPCRVQCVLLIALLR